ncbi:endonuclease/exonuclease/phosphatase family protein [Nocardioides daeguensis]|uniref:Endonuclease/exonuclease/phosphatase domain-containing protein n=1 Tax=Nocardioides daeguensis TaxID=908359 RepID=A0ABP6UQ85_9ACTN|nr:endonuclease/exonuclease/phosphatase family protein [Nocardioides daeguensis]MBV6728371.1 endonuclease/exonuclease/phosphatase family protein [Nocardioides daeguensis]MCR1773180.1 endonuclease/exonuclease/phosphatase family protein [Nocardioides daeguensis]
MRRLLSLLTVLALALGVLSALSPAGAAAQPSAPWVSAQVVAGGSVTVSLDWDYAGSGRYEILVSSAGPDVYPADAISKRMPAGPTHVDVPGLAPGTTYCYAVTLDGRGGPRSCKVTPPVSRAVVPTGTSTTAATFNLGCGSKSNCNGGWKWKKRQKQVVADIDRMNSDIMVFVEAHLAHKYGKKKRWIGKAMAQRGYTLACLTQKNKKRKLYSQTLYVRASVYDVVDAKRNSKGSRFKMFGDRNHGFCRALLQHRASGKQIAVAATHLRNGNADGTRHQETSYVLNQVTGAFPGRPTIVLGDFNSHRGLDRRGQSDAPGQVMAGAGFADASDIAAQLTYPYLNSAHAYKVDPPQSSTWPTHVDRIFVSAGITVPRWDNIAVLNGSKYATPMASDHNPIRATLYIP